MQAYEIPFLATWSLETWIAPATGVTQILILVLVLAVSVGVSVVISTLGYTPYLYQRAVVYCRETRTGNLTSVESSRNIYRL
jgi:hypothetical protein